MRALSVSAACLLFAAPIFPQQHLGTEVFGSAGWGTWWDNEGAPIGGVNVAGGIGRRLLPQFAAEGEVAGFSATRRYPGPAPVYRTRGVLLTGNGLLYVSRGQRAQVFILLGAGLAHSTAVTSFAEYRYSRSGSGFVGSAGAGVKLFIRKRVALRPEVRLVGGTAGSSRTFSAGLRFSLGVAYRW